MKPSRLVFALLVAFSASTLAPAAEMGPVIQTLRTQFSEAHTPSISELQLGHQWTCIEYLAHERDQVGAESVDNYFTFEKHSGAALFNSGRASGSWFVFTNEGFLDRQIRQVVRATPYGDLIAELLFASMAATTDGFIFPSIQDETHSVMMYSFCSR